MLRETLLALWSRFPLALLLSRAVAVPIAYTVHELGHALAATLLGDPTPRREGRLTLNPFRHTDGLGFLLGVLLGFGWSRRTVFHPHRMRLPDAPGGALAVLAGPLANAALIALGVTLMGHLGMKPLVPWSGWPTIGEFLTVLVRFNLSVVLLNALPLFPLDAYNLIHYLLPLRAAARWEQVSGWTTAILGSGIALLMLLPLNGYATLTLPVVRWANAVFLGW